MRSGGQSGRRMNLEAPAFTYSSTFSIRRPAGPKAVHWRMVASSTRPRGT